MPVTRNRRRKSSMWEEDSTPTTSMKRLKVFGRKPEEGTVPLRRSPRLISYGKFKDEPMCKPTTSMKRLKSPDKELGRKPEEEGTVPSRQSHKLIKNNGRKLLSVEEFLKRRAEAMKRMKPVMPPGGTTHLPPEQLAQFLLGDYNKKHGTDFEYVRLSPRALRSFYSLGHSIDFVEKRVMWTHFNFEARRHNADPRDEPLLLFAEVYRDTRKYVLSTLSLVKSADDANGCQSCCDSNIHHPPHGFRAGFDIPVAASKHDILSEEVAVKLSKFALQDYNEKNGTDLKFKSALQCNRFTRDGLLMDFTVKNTSWVHMNFEAIVGPKEEVLHLFGELYLVDDDKYVLATLSATEHADISPGEKEKLEIVSPCCPANIYHPWRGFRYAFNKFPRPNMPTPTSR